ncbi:hypothetical protein [Nemorincola caseinilytica]|uniref:hypothetical protein n=1 Tax=Nemorincola caseinilytica TaxID=2054315 RepID=UPI0031E8F653
MSALTCVAQAHGPRYTTTFVPAEHTLFADDLSLYSTTLPAAKWQSPGYNRAPDKGSSHASVYMYMARDGAMRPVITNARPNAQYVTFECDLWLVSPKASQLIISFPDERGYEHKIGIDDYWIHQRLLDTPSMGGCTIEGYRHNNPCAQEQTRYL